MGMVVRHEVICIHPEKKPIRERLKEARGFRMSGHLLGTIDASRQAFLRRGMTRTLYCDHVKIHIITVQAFRKTVGQEALLEDDG